VGPKTKKGLEKDFKTGGIKLPMSLCCKCGRTFLTLIRMTKDEKGLAVFKGLLL
jgi:hypothetical protein